MALPKRRHSSARRDKRKANWKLSAPSACKCGNCGAVKRPHFVCPKCGYYRDEEIIVVES
jgi:large subunit ribosomal protein L32